MYSDMPIRIAREFGWNMVCFIEYKFFLYISWWYFGKNPFISVVLSTSRELFILDKQKQNKHAKNMQTQH